jgi:predicted dehydrogenase
MKAPLGVAHIGCGSIGVLRAQAVTQCDDLKLKVVVDVRHEAAQKLARQLGCDATMSWRQAIERPDVDMVIVSTPPSSHADIAMAAAEAGKHILVEKPIAHTLEDAERMCTIAEKRGVLLKTGFNHRYFPSMAFAKQLIESGRIGEVIRVHAYAGHPGGKEFGPKWVTDGAITGGGSLVDNGIHILDLTRFFMGGHVEIGKGKGYVANLVWPFERAEDNSFALFQSSNGAIAYVHASWTEWRGYFFSVETVCTRGYVKASYPPMLAEWGEIAEPGLRAKRRYNIFPKFQILERLKSWRWTIVRSFVEEMSDFAGGIRSGTPVEPTGRDGLRTLQMAHAIYKSSAEGQEVPV